MHSVCQKRSFCAYPVSTSEVRAEVLDGPTCCCLPGLLCFSSFAFKHPRPSTIPALPPLGPFRHWGPSAIRALPAHKPSSHPQTLRPRPPEGPCKCLPACRNVLHALPLAFSQLSPNRSSTLLHQTLLPLEAIP